jgi:putrescine aminotransferase
MVRAVRDTIVMSPPLIITHEEITRLAQTIRRALDEAAPALAALWGAAPAPPEPDRP